MATQVQNRRGTTAEHTTFTGANGELTVDTTKRTLVVHDGATAGGRPLLREDQSNLPTSAPTTGIYNASGSLAISTGGSPRVTVTSTGVGVGTTPNSSSIFQAKAAINSHVAIWDYSATPMILGLKDDGSSQSLRIAGFPLTFTGNGGGGSEAARIDSSGRLLVGTSSTSANARVLLQGSSGNNNANFWLARSNSPGTGPSDKQLGAVLFSADNHVFSALIEAQRDGGTWTAGSSQPTLLVFSTTADGENSPTERMKIGSDGTKEFSNGSLKLLASAISSGAGNSTLKYNTTTGIVTYDTSSRLVKRQIVDCPYGIDELKQLQPRKYFRTDDQREEIGFIADEMAQVMPEFVPIGPKSVVTKNEDDAEQIPIGVNYEKLTAVLTKALQEAITKIETLEAKVAALESA